MSIIRYAQEIECIIEPFNNKGGLYIGNVEAALNLQTLKKHGIYAVVTVARGHKLPHSDSALPRYLYLPADDHESFNIGDFFQKSNQFISENIKVTNVLVHCVAGISRSASLVIAYLMANKSLSFQNAYMTVKGRRNKIQPNRGFMLQLQHFHSHLQSKRTYEKPTIAKINAALNISLVQNSQNLTNTSLIRPHTAARPHTANRNIILRDTTNSQYTLMRNELNQLKQNIKNLRQKFDQMKRQSSVKMLSPKKNEVIHTPLYKPTTTLNNPKSTLFRWY